MKVGAVAGASRLGAAQPPGLPPALQRRAAAAATASAGVCIRVLCQTNARSRGVLHARRRAARAAGGPRPAGGRAGERALARPGGAGRARGQASTQHACERARARARGGT
jgi:hypothetical protein